jgi:hypothetical protein
MRRVVLQQFPDKIVKTRLNDGFGLNERPLYRRTKTVPPQSRLRRREGFNNHRNTLKTPETTRNGKSSYEEDGSALAMGFILLSEVR